MSNMDSIYRMPATSLDPKANVYRLQKIYVVAIVLVTIGLVQMVTLKALNIKLIDSVPVPNFMYMVIALVCILLLVFTELFNQYPVNWTLGIVAVECLTLLTISSKWNHMPLLYAGIVFVAVVAINIILYVLGAWLPLKLLPGYYLMLFITIVFIIMYIFLSIIVFILSNRNLLLIIDLWCILYMLPLTIYASTLIHHRRLPNMPSEEYILSATVIATFFLFMMYLITSGTTYFFRMLGCALCDKYRGQKLNHLRNL